jgi:hypothetical protein
LIQIVSGGELRQELGENHETVQNRKVFLPPSPTNSCSQGRLHNFKIQINLARSNGIALDPDNKDYPSRKEADA